MPRWHQDLHTLRALHRGDQIRQGGLLRHLLLQLVEGALVVSDEAVGLSWPQEGNAQKCLSDPLVGFDHRAAAAQDGFH